MHIEPGEATRVMEALRELSLVTSDDVRAIGSIFARDFPFADVVDAADSLHVHARVDDVSATPGERIRGLGATIENQRDGYIKYRFAGGVNVIFSSIDVAMDDLLSDARAPRPHIDHIGLDLRTETPEVKALFDGAPARAKQLGWRHAAQGGEGQPVFCCHTSVALKHWIYPTAGADFARPIELAYGPLVIHGGKMGCDLRPIDPAHPRAAEAVCGAHADPAPTAADDTAGYYAREDLARFGEVGRFASPAWDAFLAYYTIATGTDGALTRRDKALIALAIAHSKQCPYCIDSFTATCVKLGVSVAEMHEAVHVAAAMAAGVDLAHATQMQKALRRHRGT